MALVSWLLTLVMVSWTLGGAGILYAQLGCGLPSAAVAGFAALLAIGALALALVVILASWLRRVSGLAYARDSNHSRACGTMRSRLR